ncbi:HAD family hydrolase [Agromyces soli]
MSASSGGAESAGTGAPAGRGPGGPVVLFDLDDTLMAHREAVHDGIDDYMRARAYAPVGAAAQRLWHELEERHYHAYLAGELSFEGQRRARAREFALAHGDALDDDAAGRWFDEYFEHYRAAWRLHADVSACFDALERGLPGVRFGIITNGELDFQLAKLARLELGERFEHIVASGEVGIAKPDARIFELALERFTASAPVRRGAYVGDRLRTDAIGAARAGLIGIWLDRHGVRPDEADTRDAEAAGVIRVPNLVDAARVLVERL